MSYVRVRFEIAEKSSDALNEADLSYEQAIALDRMLSRMTLGDMRTWAEDHGQADVMCDATIKVHEAFRALSLKFPKY